MALDILFGRTSKDPPSDIRILLAWLESDPSGDNTKLVEEAFYNIESVELIRLARVIKASGAAKVRNPTMMKRAQDALTEWNADVVIAGLVKVPKTSLSLWFVARGGSNTLDRGDATYELSSARLGDDFRAEVQGQIVAEALSLAAATVRIEERGQIATNALSQAVTKIESLVESSKVDERDRRVKLLSAYGKILSALGEREIGTESLEKSIAVHEEALTLDTSEPIELYRAEMENDLAVALISLGIRLGDLSRIEYAVDILSNLVDIYSRPDRSLELLEVAQTNLGHALLILGKRQADTDYLEQSVAASEVALGLHNREEAPADWAAILNNIGVALRNLGELGSGTDELEQAVAVFEKVREVHSRERLPRHWGTAQNNLGVALQTLGQRRDDTTLIEQAIVAHRSALEVFTREDAPLQWAQMQHNIGSALYTLGERTSGRSGTAYVEEAIKTYHAALEEHTQDREPLYWAMTQNRIGAALMILGDRGNDTRQIEDAITAYNLALEVYSRKGTPNYWAATQRNIGNALYALATRQGSIETIERAVRSYGLALYVYTREETPYEWATTHLYLGDALLSLGDMKISVEHIGRSIAAYKLALHAYEREHMTQLTPNVKRRILVADVLMASFHASGYRLDTPAWLRAALENETADELRYVVRMREICPISADAIQDTLDDVYRRSELTSPGPASGSDDLHLDVTIDCDVGNMDFQTLRVDVRYVAPSQDGSPKLIYDHDFGTWGLIETGSILAVVRSSIEIAIAEYVKANFLSVISENDDDLSVHREVSGEPLGGRAER